MENTMGGGGEIKVLVYATRDYAKFTSTDVHSSSSPMKGRLQNKNLRLSLNDLL